MVYIRLSVPELSAKEAALYRATGVMMRAKMVKNFTIVWFVSHSGDVLAGVSLYTI